MKKIFSILSLGILLLSGASCAKQELVTFDASKATAPVIQSYEVTEDAITATFSPVSFNQSFNTNIPVTHAFVLKTVDGKTYDTLLSSKEDGSTLSIANTTLSSLLIRKGYAEGDMVALSLAIRGNMKGTVDNGSGYGSVESDATIDIASFEVVVPKGSPYKDYTQDSDWTVIGSLSAYGISWDGDLNMWTDGVGNHVAAHVQLAAGDEFKFRKDLAWTVNMGGSFSALDAEFSVTQDGANIVVGADGVYDLYLNPDNGIAWITTAFDPYPTYTETSNWSVIGALAKYNISWDGDLAMISDGTNHLAVGVSIASSDEFKFRQDQAWTVNMGGTFAGLDTEFTVAQDGANIVIGTEGVYDLFLNPDAGTAKVIETAGGKVSSKVGGEEPEPDPPVTISGWNIIGLNGDWDNDVLASENGGVWTAFITAEADTEFKWRKDGGWDENYGGDMVSFNEPFAAVAGGNNIAVGAGFYKVVLDLSNADAPTITVYDDFEVWSLIGDFNSWAGDVDMVEENGVWVAADVELSGGWKIRKNHGWDENRGGVFTELGVPFAAVAGGDNIDCGEGKYTVTYNPADETITVSEGTVWSLIGDFNSWGADVDMVQEDGLWVAREVDLSGGWKIRKNHDWTENRGGVFAELGVAFTAAPGGDNINCGEGKFNVVYDPSAETITVTAASYGWSVIGADGDWNTDHDMTEVMPGIWVSPEITTSTDWKIRYDHGWDVNRGGEAPSAEGAFVQAVPNGSNVNITGTFKVVYNANNETLGTLYWGVVGSIASIEGFSWNNDVPMNLGADGKWYSIPVALTTTDEIKLRLKAGWDVNRGGTCEAANTPFAVENNGANIKAPADGTYMLVYDPTEETITLSTEFWGLIGDFNSWGGDVFMLYDGAGNWSAYRQSLAGGWKLRQGAGWDVNRGGVYASDGEPFAVENNGPNISVDLETFHVVYNVADETVTVSSAN